VRGAGPVSEPLDSFGFVAFQAAVIRLSADAVIAAGCCDVAADFLNVTQDPEPVFVLRSS
jgi:hypothetical protein